MPKRTLIIASGLTHTGKTTTFSKLRAALGANCIHIQKDVIAKEIGVPSDPKDEKYDELNAKSYDEAIQQALDALHACEDDEHRVVILDAFLGNKLTKSFVKKLIDSPEFDVRVVYFHCSGETQKARIDELHDPRDCDKTGDQFVTYRNNQLADHAREATQTGCLFVDTENDINKNVNAIKAYLNDPIFAPCYNPIKPAFTEDVYSFNGDQFKQLMQQHEDKTRSVLMGCRKQCIIIDMELFYHVKESAEITFDQSMLDFIAEQQQKGIQVCATYSNSSISDEQMKRALLTHDIKLNVYGGSDCLGKVLRHNPYDAKDCVFISASRAHQLEAATGKVCCGDKVYNMESMVTIQLPCTTQSSSGMVLNKVKGMLSAKCNLVSKRHQLKERHQQMASSLVQGIFSNIGSNNPSAKDADVDLSEAQPTLK